MSGGWPPLVGSNTLPRWKRVRDALLTLALWLVLLWMLLPFLLALWAGLHWLVGMPLAPQYRPLRPKWDVAAPFLLLIAILVVALLRFGWTRRDTLKAKPHLVSEAALDPHQHAAYFGLDTQRMQSLRDGKALVVQVDTAGLIETID